MSRSFFLPPRATFLLLCLSGVLFATGFTVVQAPLAVPAGLSEFYIPAEADQLWNIFVDNDNDPILVSGSGLHYVIAVTASTDNTSVYYDHWENGYGFDPVTLLGADEFFAANEGQVLKFESTNVPVLPRGTGMNVCTSTHPPGSTATTFCYDGRDRIYIVGGVATVTLAAWPQSIGTVYAFAWELYPTKPYQTQYVIPVGINLFGAPFGYQDFANVYVLVQATADGTTVQIDDPQTPGVEINTTLNKGEVLDRWDIWAGTTISASAPVQSQFIVGRSRTGLSSEARGYTTVPSSLWNNEYYSPVYGAVGNGTDLYLYNPNAASITITWADSTGAGNITLAPGATRAYSDAPPNGAGHKVPADSAVHLLGTGTFWGIGSVDTEAANYDWNFSLIPSSALTTEYFLGWAPGTSQATPTNNCSPVWVTATENDTAVLVDYGPTDGIFDESITIDRLQVLRLYDPDFDNTGMRIVASAPIAVAWGEANLNGTGAACGVNVPNMDLGYTVLPQLAEFIDVVLNIEKSVDPPEIPNEAGQVVTFTLVTTTEAYPVEDVVIADLLPTPWEYVDDSTTITFPDFTVLTGDPADPTITGQILTWDLGLDMNPDETLVIRFRAITTAPPDGVTVNQATATGTSNGQTYTSKDSETVNIFPSPTAIQLLQLGTQSLPSSAWVLATGILLLLLLGGLLLFRPRKPRA